MFPRSSRFAASICTSLFALSSSLIPLQAAALTSQSDDRSGERKEGSGSSNRPVETAGNGCVLGICPLTELFERQLRSLLNKQIPIQATNNHEVYPTVERLPGEPFDPLRYDIFSDDEVLAPGDYELDAYFPCTRIYSFTGSGNQYVLAKLKGKMADVLAATHERAGQAGTPVRQVQELSWSIQAGVPYRELPEQHQALVDTLIPEYRQKMKADFMDTFFKRYDALSKLANLPSRDEILNKLGLVGDLARDLMRARQRILNTSLAYRSLESEFAPRQNVASSGSLEETPWSVVEKGIYMRFLAPQGALHEGVVQFRITEEAGKNEQRKEFNGAKDDTQLKAIPLVVIGIGFVEANTIRIIVSRSVAIALRHGGQQALTAILLNQSNQTGENNDKREEIHSPRRLGRNLQKAGFKRPPETAAHHIVGNGDLSRPAQDILKKWKIGINDAENGVFLPRTHSSSAPGTLHIGRHIDTYITEVNTRLIKATSRERAIEILEEIRDDLLNRRLNLN